MAAPAFLRRPQPQAQKVVPSLANVSQETVNFFERIAEIERTRDILKDNLHRTQASLAEAERENEFLRKRLHESEYRMAFYQRHYLALDNRLVDIAETIDRVRSEVRSEAAEHMAETDQHPRDLDEAGLRNIVEKFKPSQGDRT